jgi:integrase
MGYGLGYSSVERGVRPKFIALGQLPNLLLKMESYDGDALTRLAMRLMAYTFVRTSELIESQWPEFDLEHARWDIPAAQPHAAILIKSDSPSDWQAT